ncbi:MAG: alpha/beta fold hydrolase, partial [Rhodanobacteraceae bacterium]
GDRVFLLLHGLVSSGDTFGSDYDRLAAHGRLVVPDLLGFSRSMSEADGVFSLEDHLDSLDEMVNALDANKARFVVVGHSLGALIALHWAARRTMQVDAVILFGAPLFRDEAEARRQLKEMGSLESLFAQNSSLAEKSCALMCAHRRLAGFLAIALSPDLPIAVSSKAVLHTWPAYRGALSIFFSNWPAAIQELEEHHASISLIAGDEDESQVAGLADSLAAKYSCVNATFVKGAAHILPITHGILCAETILREAAMSDRQG